MKRVCGMALAMAVILSLTLPARLETEFHVREKEPGSNEKELHSGAKKFRVGGKCTAHFDVTNSSSWRSRTIRPLYV